MMVVQSSVPHRYIAHLIDTPAVGQIRVRPSCIVVDERGYISSITQLESHWSLTDDTNTTILPSTSFLLPTYADLHIHAAQYLYAGTGLDLPLMQWLDKYAYAAEERVDGDEELAERVYARLVERFIQNGTGAALVFGTLKLESNLILARAFLKAGLRGFVGKLSMDISSRPSYTESSSSESLSSAKEFISSMRGLVSSLPEERRLVQPVLTPRFVPTCSDELLDGLGKLAKDEGVMVQSHMCESVDQMDWVRDTREKEDEEVFDHHGLLTNKTVQAHVTSLPSHVRDLLHDRGVAIAHCPLSNVYFSDAQFPLREVIDRPLRIGLGSDIAGGYNISIETQMRQSVLIARQRESRRQDYIRQSAQYAKSGKKTVEPPVNLEMQKNLRVEWKESLYLATRGGAEALGLGGLWEVGMPFDAQRIDLVDQSTGQGRGALDFFDLPPNDSASPEETTAWLESVLERWWCNGDARNRSGMWIQGNRIM